MALNLALLGFELLFLAGLAFFLHARSRRYGLAPFLIFVSGLVALLQAVSPLHVQVEVLDHSLIVSSLTVVPVILMALLILYVVDGTAAARVAVLGILSLSILVLVFQVGLESHISLPGGRSMVDLPGGNPLFQRSWSLTLASLIAFGGSLFAVTIVYQSLCHFPSSISRWVAPGGALLVALLVDEVVFQAVSSGWDGVSTLLSGNLLGKAAGAFILWPLITPYLNRFAPQMEGYVGTQDRRPMDMVFGSYKKQESALQATRLGRIQAERALEAVELRFQTTFEQVGVGLVLSDGSGTFHRVNQAMCDLLGYAERDLLKETWTSITPPGEGESAREGRRLLTEGLVDLYEVDKRYLRRDGTHVWVHITSSLVRDSAGEPDYYVTAVEDLTERRATEESLRQAQKMEAVGQLTGGIAHDFNNLLTVIMGGIELGMDKGADAEEKDKVLADAFQAAQRGASLTQRLLAFSRKQPLRPSPLNTVVVLEEMRELLTRTLGETIQIKIDSRGKVGDCLADRTQLESAVLNLALNARDAMPGGGKLRIRSERIQVSAEELPQPEVQPGDYVRIGVTDDGTGIPAEIQEKVFDPFFTTKETGKGSGLGLSMVYGFTRQSGGFVILESLDGEGTSVWMHLPTSLD